MTNYEEYIPSPKEKRAVILCIALAALLLSILLFHNILFSLVMLPFFKKINEIYIEYMKENRHNHLLEQFKDLLFILSTSIGAGRGMRDAIGEAINGINGIYGENSIMSQELKNMYKRMDVGNEDDVTVLIDFARRSNCEDIIDFTITYATCKETGASLIVALNKAASVIIEKMSIENEISAMVKRKKQESLILFLMPFIVITFLNISAPEYIEPLYSTLIGRLIMISVIAVNIYIYAVLQKITNVEI